MYKLFSFFISILAATVGSLKASDLGEEAYEKVLCTFEAYRDSYKNKEPRNWDGPFKTPGGLEDLFYDTFQKKARNSEHLQKLQSLSLKGSPEARKIFQELIHIDSALTSQQTSLEIVMEELFYQRTQQLVRKTGNDQISDQVDAYFKDRFLDSEKRSYRKEILPYYQRSRREIGLIYPLLARKGTLPSFKPFGLSDQDFQDLHPRAEEFVEISQSVKGLESRKESLEKALQNALIHQGETMIESSEPFFKGPFAFSYHQIFNQCDRQTRRLNSFPHDIRRIDRMTHDLPSLTEGAPLASWSCESYGDSYANHTLYYLDDKSVKENAKQSASLYYKAAQEKEKELQKNLVTLKEDTRRRFSWLSENQFEKKMMEESQGMKQSYYSQILTNLLKAQYFAAQAKDTNLYQDIVKSILDFCSQEKISYLQQGQNAPHFMENLLLFTPSFQNMLTTENQTSLLEALKYLNKDLKPVDGLLMLELLTAYRCDPSLLGKVFWRLWSLDDRWNSFSSEDQKKVSVLQKISTPTLERILESEKSDDFNKTDSQCYWRRMVIETVLYQRHQSFFSDQERKLYLAERTKKFNLQPEIISGELTYPPSLVKMIRFHKEFEDFNSLKAIFLVLSKKRQISSQILDQLSLQELKQISDTPIEDPNLARFYEWVEDHLHDKVLGENPQEEAQKEYLLARRKELTSLPVQNKGALFYIDSSLKWLLSDDERYRMKYPLIFEASLSDERLEDFLTTLTKEGVSSQEISNVLSTLPLETIKKIATKENVDQYSEEAEKILFTKNSEELMPYLSDRFHFWKNKKGDPSVVSRILEFLSIQLSETSPATFLQLKASQDPIKNPYQGCEAIKVIEHDHGINLDSARGSEQSSQKPALVEYKGTHYIIHPDSLGGRTLNKDSVLYIESPKVLKKTMGYSSMNARGHRVEKSYPLLQTSSENIKGVEKSLFISSLTDQVLEIEKKIAIKNPSYTGHPLISRHKKWSIVEGEESKAVQNYLLSELEKKYPENYFKRILPQENFGDKSYFTGKVMQKMRGLNQQPSDSNLLLHFDSLVLGKTRAVVLQCPVAEANKVESGQKVYFEDFRFLSNLQGQAPVIKLSGSLSKAF